MNRLLVFALPLALFAQTVFAQTTISFEEFPAQTVVTHQYAQKGIHLHGESIDTASAAHSGTRALYSVAVEAEQFSFPGPIAIDFDNGQRAVRLFAGAFGAPEIATLSAFDADGNRIAVDGPRVVPALSFSTMLEVQVGNSTIRRVELLYADDHDELIDDLTFDGLGPGDLPTQPPVVTITSPTAGQTTGAATFLVEGRVEGPRVDPHASLRSHVLRPPGSSVTAEYSYPVELLARGPADVGFVSQLVSLDIGPQTLTLDAQNVAGLHGTASVVIDALPDAIRTRFTQEGGQAALGGFSFGSVNAIGECTYAVYAQAAVAAYQGNTFVVRGSVLQKWLALKDQGGFPRLGCPRGEEHAVAGGGRAQDFVAGRIYTSALGTFFVEPVFSAAIDALGGEAGVGLPNADPTSDSRPVFNTWLFQRFVRRGFALDSTLEIRGDPARLWVERQAGDGSLFAELVRAASPTLVESFACATTQGPCSVTAPADEAPFSGATALCHGKEFDWKTMVSGLAGWTPDPPEWVPIRGDYVQVPIWGVLFDVHLAKGDNPFTHRNHFDPCPAPLLEALANEEICPSDWDLKLRPLPGYRSLQAVHRNAVQIEFERVDFQHQLVGYGDPTPGDLVFASGRYVVDCGHGGDHLDAFKTEIHPPSVYAAVRSTTFNARPATEADIWVNRFFPGGNNSADAVELDVYPPPRPDPQATLGASLPADQNAAVSVTFQPIAPFGPVRVRVTASRGAPQVTKYGEMKPRDDNVAFGFDGRLHVYWSSPSSCVGCTEGQTRACGRCGVQTCQADCTWSVCSSQGSCSPGAIQACCPCGRRGCSCPGERTCGDDCAWSACSGQVCGQGSCP